MTPKKYRVRIDLLNLPAKPDFDEIVLKSNGRKIFPLNEKFFKIKGETVIPINIEFEIEQPRKPLLIELWEFRYFLPDDYIGLFRLDPLKGETTETEMTNNTFSVKISLVWSASQVGKAVYQEAEKQLG